MYMQFQQKCWVDIERPPYIQVHVYVMRSTISSKSS